MPPFILSRSSHFFLRLAPLPTVGCPVARFWCPRLVVDKDLPPAHLDRPLLLDRNFRRILLLELHVAKAFLLLRVLPYGQANRLDLPAEREGLAHRVFRSVVGPEGR